VFQGFLQAEFADVGSISSSSQRTQLPHLPLETMLDLKKGPNQLKNNHLAFII